MKLVIIKVTKETECVYAIKNYRVVGRGPNPISSTGASIDNGQSLVQLKLKSDCSTGIERLQHI